MHKASTTITLYMVIKTTCISPRPFLLPLMYWPMYLSPFGHSNLVNSIPFCLQMKKETVTFSKFLPALSIHKVHENLPSVPAHIYAYKLEVSITQLSVYMIQSHGAQTQSLVASTPCVWKLFFGCFLLRLSRIKHSQGISRGNLAPRAIGFFLLL